MTDKKQIAEPLPPLRERFGRIAERYPAFIAGYTDDDFPISFAAMGAMTAEVERLVQSGTRRVGLVLPNSLEGVAALYAVWNQGASAALMSDVLPLAEVRRRVSEVGADSVIWREGREWKSGPGYEDASSLPVPDDEMVVIFTSGTTGRPKGVSKSVAAITSMVTTVSKAGGIHEGRWPADPPRQPYIVMSPLSHLQGLIGSLIAGQMGQPLLVMAKFDADRVFEIVNSYEVRTLRLGPAMVYDLTRKAAGRTLGGVKAVTVGTAELPEAIRRQFEECFGVPALRTYGQTETGTIAFERYVDVVAQRRPDGSVGRAAPGVEVRIMGESGEVPVGQLGEVYVRGPETMSGYVHRASRSDPIGDGFIATGDLGSVDADGFLYLNGRRGDVIICGGFNIYPAVVEAALQLVPGIEEALVIGEADERLGEVPVALVRLAHGVLYDAPTVETALRDQLSPYEIPRRFEIVGVLPRTANGKLDRSRARGGPFDDVLGIVANDTPPV